MAPRSPPEPATHSPPPTEQLVRRAQASGALRADLVATDLPLIQFMVSSAPELTPPNAPQLWRRYLAAVIGLRTPDPHTLPHAAPSHDELDAAVRKRHEHDA